MKHTAYGLVMLPLLVASMGLHVTAQDRDILWMKGTHMDAAIAVEYAPTFDIIVSASHDSTLRVWAYSSGNYLRKLKLKAPVTTMDLASDGRRVVIGDQSGRLSIWDITTGAVLRDLAVFNDPVLKAEFLHGGTHIVAADRRSLRLFETASGTNMGTATLTPDLVSLALTPNGNTIALGFADGTVRVGNPMAPNGALPLEIVTPGLTNIILNPQGDRMFVAFKDSIRAINRNDGTHTDIGVPNFDTVKMLAVNPQGTLLVVGGRYGLSALQLPGLTPVFENIITAYRALGASFDASNNTLITCTPFGEIYEWDMNSWQPLRTITRSVHTTAVSADGRYIAAAGGLPTTVVWSNDGTPVMSIDTVPPSELALSHDGRLLALAYSGYNDPVSVFDVTTHSRIQKFMNPAEGWVDRLRFLPERKLLMVKSRYVGNTICASGLSRSDGTVWDPLTGTQGSELFTGRTAMEHLALSSDGTMLATSGPFIPCDGGYNIRPIQSLRIGVPYSTKAFPNTELYVTGVAVDSRTGLVADADGRRHRVVRLWNVNTQEDITVPSADTISEGGAAYSVAFSPGGRLLASGRTDGIIRFIDVGTRTQVYAFDEYDGPQAELFFSTGTPTFVSRTTDGALIVWSTEKFQNAIAAAPTPQGTSAPLSAAPNPTSGEIAIDFTLDESCPVRATIIAADGREVAALADGRYDAGRHTLTWDAAGASAGLYLCRLETGRGVRMCRVVVMR